MEGLHVVKQGKYLQSFKTMYGNNHLISTENNFEIIEQVYYKGSSTLLLPLKSPNNKDYYYIVSGLMRMNSSKEEFFFRAGDFFSVEGIEETLKVHVLEDTKWLWFSSEPMFSISNEYHNLRYKYLEKIQQRDNYTAEHCSRVTEYTMSLLKKMNFEIERTVSILHSATLHDIGKIYICDEILNKTGPLTKEEFEIMKSHSAHGYEVVKDIVAEPISKAIFQHHERLNGSGYPLGLKDDEIMLEAKILAVVDSYDAMTTDRPYKKAMTPQAAIEELKRCIGNLYEKDIVEKFEEVLKEDGLI